MKPRNYIFTSLHFFILAGIVFIPVELNFLPWQKNITVFIFEKPVAFLSENLFDYPLRHRDFSSDSVSLYILLFLLFSLSFIAGGLWMRLSTRPQLKENTTRFIRMLAVYYIALLLFKYGFNKVFKWQFFLPEPNLLFTPMGQLDKDILYWSSMGTSYGYTVFAGLIEIIPATLILFRTTRTVGLLIALPVMLNVVAINFGFDISVKLISLFMTLVVLFLLAPQFKSLYQFLILKKNVEPIAGPGLSVNSRAHSILKPLFIVLLLSESLYPYIKTQNFNDDIAERPFLHGAWEIKFGTLPDPDASGWSIYPKRFYIHREGYIIFEDRHEKWNSYKYHIDTDSNCLHIYGRQHVQLYYNYSSKDTSLTLVNGPDSAHVLKAKPIDWRKLPAMQDKFNWTVDEYR